MHALGPDSIPISAPLPPPPQQAGEPVPVQTVHQQIAAQPYQAQKKGRAGNMARSVIGLLGSMLGVTAGIAVAGFLGLGAIPAMMLTMGGAMVGGSIANAAATPSAQERSM